MEQDEKIIRDEAESFFNTKLISTNHNNAVDDFKEIKSRLYDFYPSESKAIFLDEIQNQLITFLKNHRIESHGGLAKPDCHFEQNIEKVLFYIRQELNTLPIVVHQLFKSNPKQKREKVFISYSHVDKEYLEEIKRHFKPFLNQIDYWDDTKIQPGQKWKTEIANAINETKVAILLVSTDFLGSEFISTDELPPLLKAAEENGAVILTVILRPCLFEEFEELNQYQALNPPTNPVIKMDSTEKEDLWVNLVRQTKKILHDQKSS